MGQFNRFDVYWLQTNKQTNSQKGLYTVNPRYMNT